MNELWTFLELDRRNEHSDYDDFKSKMLDEESTRVTVTQKKLDERFSQLRQEFLSSAKNTTEIFADDVAADSSAKIFCEILQQKD